jgi:hypothetical protein
VDTGCRTGTRESRHPALQNAAPKIRMLDREDGNAIATGHVAHLFSGYYGD